MSPHLNHHWVIIQLRPGLRINNSSNPTFHYWRSSRSPHWLTFVPYLLLWGLVIVSYFDWLFFREECQRKRLADYRATVARISRLHKEVHLSKQSAIIFKLPKCWNFWSILSETPYQYLVSDPTSATKAGNCLVQRSGRAWGFHGKGKIRWRHNSILVLDTILVQVQNHCMLVLVNGFRHLHPVKFSLSQTCIFSSILKS